MISAFPAKKDDASDAKRLSRSAVLPVAVGAVITRTGMLSDFSPECTPVLSKIFIRNLIADVTKHYKLSTALLLDSVLDFVCKKLTGCR